MTGRLDDVRDRDWRGFAIRVTALVGSMLGVLAALYITFRLAGAFATILYVFLFVMFLTLAPLLINLLGNAMPGSTMMGRGHIILGAFAFNNHYLVDRGTRWEWCPGDEDRVYIDEEWHDIDGGLENKSVLGWRPFGILRYKDDDETLQEVRVDEKALSLRDRDADVTADGGSIERGGYHQQEKDIVSGVDGTWLVDLKRVYSRGVKKIGDIEIIETAEEIIERGQINDSKLGLDNPTVTFFASLVFGVITGFAYVYVMGV